MSAAKITPSAHPFHVMAKPAGASCNLACTYCYYLDKSALYPATRMPRMTPDTLEHYVINLIQSQPVGGEVVFAWQGGEPTLLGIDFYRQAVALQQRHAAGRRIENVLQTNATLLNAEWCRFFVAARFLVGVSLDGPAAIHDHYRLSAGQRSTHAAVMEGLHSLQTHGVEFNVLACVHRLSAKHPLAVYEFLRTCGAKFIQFIPVVEQVPGTDTATEWSVLPEDYADFMIAIFERWYSRDIGDLMVMNFEWALANHMRLPGSVCHHQPICGRSLAVEHNGNVYACDHFVDAQHRLGNVCEQPLSTLVDAQTQRRFGLAKANSLPEQCIACPVLQDCWGGCPKHRFVATRQKDAALNYLCTGYRRFFMHALPRLAILAKQIEKQTAPDECVLQK